MQGLVDSPKHVDIGPDALGNVSDTELVRPMFMIAEAVDDTGLQTFMAPFREAGSVDVVPIDADTARAFLENLPLLGALPTGRNLCFSWFVEVSIRDRLLQPPYLNEFSETMRASETEQFTARSRQERR
jgi:hypothetical protein